MPLFFHTKIMRIVFLFLLSLALTAVQGQSVVQLKGDTIKVFKTGGTAELVIQNRTKDSLGVLVNMGNGRTQFMRAKLLDPSTIVVGNDTLHIAGSGGSGSSFSGRMLTSTNFSTAVNCPLPALNGDSLQIFWNDLGRYLVEGTEWQNLAGGGFKILVPGFDATANSYSLTVYANNIASPPGPVNFTSSNFTTATNCPITADNGMTLQIYWNDAGRYLIQGTDFNPLAGGGFTITIPGFNATTTNYSFYVFAQ
jgi:hypothetical protein